MRKHELLHHILHTNNNPSCPSSQIISDRCKYDATRPSISGPGPFQFSYTDFFSCSTSGDGGAIVCSASGASLSIEDCTFIDCICTTSYHGAAIFAKSLSLVSVTSSLFLWNTNVQQAHCGAALFLHTVSSVAVHEDTVIHSYVLHDGGAVDIENGVSADIGKKTFYNCRFIHCRGAESNGGAIFVYQNNYNDFLTNSLFSSCSNNQAGAVLLCDSTYTGSRYPIQFCLFHANSATSNGKDILFSNIQSSTYPISHSFTTSSGGNRVYPEHWDTTKQQDNWFPDGIEVFILTDSTQENTHIAATIRDIKTNIYECTFDFTEIIYSIICSGLTHKTRLSFTSSNSSFIYCVRRHNRKFASQKNNFIYSTRKRDNNRETLSRRQSLTSSVAHSFTHTDFTNCESTGSNPGGAIYCTSGSLKLEDCTFTNCKSYNRSGAVYFRCQNLCNDTNNLFVNSSSGWHTGTFDDWSATQSIHSSSTFINSITPGHFGIINR